MHNHERKGIEVLVETFIRKQLGLKAHTVTKVEETEEFMIIHIDRLGDRLLRCGLCRQRCRKVHSVRKEREWRDLSMRKLVWSPFKFQGFFKQWRRSGACLAFGRS